MEVKTLRHFFDSQSPSLEKIILIAGKDNERIPIHRALLAERSKYFAFLLGPKFGEIQPKEFILSDIDGEMLKMIVAFCYKEHTDLTEDNVNELLTIALLTDFKFIENECRIFYENKLSITNSIDTWEIAEKHNYVDLKQLVVHFVCKNFEKMPKTEIQRMDHCLVQELLQQKKMGRPGEMFFKSLIMWCESSEAERKPHMPELLQLIPIKYLSLQFLTDTVEPFYINFHCSELVIAEYKRRLLDAEDFRSKSIFCLNFARNLAGKISVIIIQKYNAKKKGFVNVDEINLTDPLAFAPAVTNHTNKLYILDGTINGEISSTYCMQMSSYDLNTLEKEVLPGMNEPRISCTLASLGKYIFVFGGSEEFDGNGKGVTNSCERFNTDTKTWETIASMNFGRIDAAATVLNNVIYVAGGYGRAYNKLNAFESYNPKSGEWTQLAPMNKSRYNFSLIESNGLLYAIGGEEIIERYDPKENTWTMIGSYRSSHNITSGVDMDGQLCVMMFDGEFGQIKVNENGKCSFLRLGEKKNPFFSVRYLFQN